MEQQIQKAKTSDEKFCSECGATIKAKFFLGGFGIHKFYLGQVGLGIIYLIFCWTIIPAIVAFIEFIILLTMNDETFNQKYGME